MGLFGSGYDKDRLRTNLKMAVTRINLAKNKKVNLIKVQKREISDLLRSGKDESARIKVENVIREEYTIEAFELIELFCELLQARQQLINESKSCPSDLKEAVSTIIYAAPRMEVKELLVIRDQLGKKFGKDFYVSAAENKDLAVNQRVMFKLGVKVPEPYLCVQYLKDIAREHNVEWNDESAITAVEMPIMGGGQGGMGGMGGGGMPQNFAPGPPPGGYPPQPHQQHQQQQQPPPQQQPPQQYNGGHPPQQFMGGPQPQMPPAPHQQQQHQQPPQQHQQRYSDSFDTKSNGSHSSYDQSTPTSAAPRQEQNFGAPPQDAQASPGGNDDRDDDDGDGDGGSGGMAYDFDDLQRRFDALKKRD